MSLHDLPPIWCVYDKPLDAPEHVVVREWRGTFASLTAFRFDSVQEARDYLYSKGLKCIGRDPSDESQIVESWI